MSAFESSLIAVSMVGVVTAAVLLVFARRRAVAAEAATTEERERRLEVADALRVAEADRVLAQEINRVYVEESRHLVEKRLPAEIADRVHGTAGVSVPGLLHDRLTRGAVAEAHKQVVELVCTAVSAARDGVAGAARAVVRHALDGPQTRLLRLQHQIMAELDAHADAPPAVIESLMRLDAHASAVAAGVQRLRILAGAVPGVQRDTSPLAEVVEAARGRIDAHTDVTYLHDPATGGVWLTGRLVEPVVVALAELLDNATTHSTRRVDVTIQDVAAGYAITVDDRGIAMNQAQRERANTIMGTRAALDVTSLGDALQLGHAVIGQLAARYGFRVEIAGPTAYGGNRAVLLIPATHITTTPPDTSGNDEPSAYRLANPTTTRQATTPADGDPTGPGAANGAAAGGAVTASGLPVRRRSVVPAGTPPAAGVRVVNADTGSLDPNELEQGLTNLTSVFGDHGTNGRDDHAGHDAHDGRDGLDPSGSRAGHHDEGNPR